MDYQPYTYFIKWSDSGVWYYGVEYAEITKTAHPSNLWVSYFTSSKAVSEYRSIHGEPDIIQIRRIFSDSDSAILWEARFLQRVNAASNPLSLNGHNSDGLSFKNKIVSEETRDKISAIHKGIPKSPETRAKQSIARKKYYNSEEGKEWLSKLSQNMSMNNPSKPGKTPWNKGVPMAEEVKSKVSSTLKEIWDDPDMKEKQSIRTKQMWESGIFDNRPAPTQESIDKRIKTNRKNGFKQTEYQRKRVSETMKDKPKSEETKAKMRENMEKKRQDTKICEHCNFVGWGSTFSRYHGDKCKHKPL